MTRAFRLVLIAAALVVAWAAVGSAAHADSTPTVPTVPVTLPITAPITVPAPPTSPPTVPVSAPTPPTPPTMPSGGGTATDPCAQITGPLTAGGAPAAASCPLTPASDGGDGSLCVDATQHPSCADAKSTDPTTTTPASTTSTTTRDGETSGPSNGGTADPTTVVAAAGAAQHVSRTHSSSGTLPLTGGAVAGLVTLGGALAASGAALARAARSRRRTV